MLFLMSFGVGGFVTAFHRPAHISADDAVVFLIVAGVVSFFIVFAVVAQAIRDLRRKPNPPDYDCEILTFDTDKFIVQDRGIVTSFAYRFDTRPVLSSFTFQRSGAELLIPCSPLEDRVTGSFSGGYYNMWIDVDSDAERVLAALKEHLAAIEPLQRK